MFLGLTLITLSSLRAYSDGDGHDLIPVITVLVMSILLTIIALMCEIPVVVAQCRSSQILNNRRFRILV